MSKIITLKTSKKTDDFFLALMLIALFFIHLKNITRDETIIASNLNFTNLTINSAQNLNITSGADTNITTALENDYFYSFHEKKTPSIAAAISNSVVKIFNEVMPSFGNSKSDNTESNDQVKELVYDQSKNNKGVRFIP